MASPAAFQGDYVEIRFIKTRKVAQIWVEIPIEAATAFVAAFGAPNPATTVPVALARLDTSMSGLETIKGGKLTQKAAIISNQKAFWEFVNALDKEEAAQKIRNRCGVQSRSEIDRNPYATKEFNALVLEYEAWLKVAA